MKTKKLITKSNYLNEARYKLTALEQKIILFVVSKINPNDKDFITYDVSISELNELLNSNSNSFYEDLRRAIRGLLHKTLEIYNEKDKSTLFCNWFSSVKYDPKYSLIHFRIDPDLRPYLLKLKDRFVSYNLKNILHLKSFYSIRLYELLKQYEKIGKRSFKLDELKNILKIEPEEYQRYNNFKIRVLDVACDEIKEKTDLYFEYEGVRIGKAIGLINFIIYAQNQKIANTISLQETLSLLPEKYKNDNLIINIINESLLKYDPECVGRNIKYANRHSKTNYKVFLIKSIESDWGKELLEEEKQKEKAQSELFSKQELKAKEDQYREDIESFIEENKEELEKEALSKLDDEQAKDFKKGGSLGFFALNGIIWQLAEEKFKKSQKSA